MKKNKLFSLLSAAVVAAGMGMTSCADKLDLAPIDVYGAGNFWKTEAQAVGNLSTQMNLLRSFNFQINITFGEIRGGAYTLSAGGSDGASLAAEYLRSQNLSQTNNGAGNFGGYWKLISDMNLFIANVEEATYFSSEDKKNYCLGMVYGMRAYIYFQMFRAYGGVPLRLTPDVAQGNYDPTTLYMPRATASETMNQIKADISKSLNYFGSQTSFNFDGKSKNAKYYWSKAATEMLAGEVYLWTSKVSTGDQAANKGDLATAKTHFQSVINNYGLSLQSDFAKVFAPDNERNSEIILALVADETEATNSIPSSYVYSTITGYTIGSAYDSEGNIWNDPLQYNGGLQRYQFANALWYQYDTEDTRRDATFVASWHDQAATQLRGTFVCKNLGSILPATGYRCLNGDQPLYRLALAYLSLAEIANMEGDAAGVKKNIDIIRERAYGANWDAAVYGYTPGTFVENEVAVLHEKDKEFVQEGQRWHDVRRMSISPNCGELDHLVFHNEGHIAYGLEVTENMKEMSPNKWEEKAPDEIVVTPILDKAYAYRVLWPLSTSDLNNDKTLTQTPGYEE